MFDIGLDSDTIDFCWAQTQLLWFNISAFESRVRPAESMDALSFLLGNLLAVVMQVMSTCYDLLHNKPPLYYLALDISAMKNHFLTLSSLPRRYNPLVPIAHTLDAVVQLLTRALCFCHHVTCSLFSFCWRQQ